MNNKLIIKAVGDIAPGDSLIDGLGICSLTKKYGCDYPFQKLNGFLNSTDLLLGNLEGTLSHECLTHDLRLCGLPNMAGALREIGFDVLSVANNHIFDHGEKIFKETIDYCTAAGIELCGLRGESNYYSQPVIINKRSLTIGILAYNWIGLEEANNEVSKYIATVKDSVVNYTWNRDRKKDIQSRNMVLDKNKDVFNDIKRLRGEVDILILMPHWGYEWVNHPPYGVILEAHSFIEAGVDLIMGSHPHVVQGFEKYGDGVIAYSLGNFLFDFCTKKYGSGMILESEIVAGKLKNCTPRFITWNENFQPEEAVGDIREKYVQIMDRSDEIISSVDPERLLDDDLLYKTYEKTYNNLKSYKVVFLLRKLLFNPFLIKPIAGKFYALVQLIISRFRGKKVRW